jgi:hypothetical protein
VTFSLTVVACHGTTVSTSTATATVSASTPTTATTFVHASLFLCTAILAPHGLIRESLTGVKVLFLGGKGKVRFAIATLQSLVLKVAFVISSLRGDIFTSRTLLAFTLGFFHDRRLCFCLVIATGTSTAIVVAHDAVSK